MNQTEMAAAVKKMQTYVALAEQEISARNVECQLLQDELAMARRLRESLEEKLRETEETLCRQQSLRRVSQFMLEKIESGGTIQVWMTTE
jgi:predicted RNase H-like nuclease (RuvC/YqgF family)